MAFQENEGLLAHLNRIKGEIQDLCAEVHEDKKKYTHQCKVFQDALRTEKDLSERAFNAGCDRGLAIFKEFGEFASIMLDILQPTMQSRYADAITKVMQVYLEIKLNNFEGFNPYAEQHASQVGALWLRAYRRKREKGRARTG